MYGGGKPGLDLDEDVVINMDDNKTHQPEPQSPSSQSVMGGLVRDMGKLGSELATLCHRIEQHHLSSPQMHSTPVPGNSSSGTSDLAPGVVVLDSSGRGCHNLLY